MPVVARNADGRLRIFLRNGGGGVSTYYQAEPNGGWNQDWVDLKGMGVRDGLAAVTAPNGADARVTLFGRYLTGVKVVRQNGPNVGYGDWTDLSGGQVDQHTAVVDDAGVVTVCALTADGGVRMRRQSGAGADVPFCAWQGI
ncbi:hypothetical protein [Crossiella cryophila]|uniref:PLL-like beta propeller domain-containing protein n=1 Tax=Crossiella cryophila TaxID=43355 RepID=A0A7W7FTM8_9PSEU|nr:hypothetical protein [Crossiella cryophila]MBB4677377.1 hypothetical protein [Crossiella cryophila]